jgi:hypothetical protein
MTEHLELHYLTSFAARYHLTCHVRAQGQTELDEAVLGEIEAAANKLGTDEKAMLADNFARFSEAVAEEHDRHHSQLSEELAAGLKDLIKSLHLNSCGECFENKDRWCKPKGQTYGNVTERGLCISPLKDLFTELSDWVGSLWSNLPSNTGTTGLPVILFSTTSRAFTDRDGREPIIERFDIGGFARSIYDRDGVHTKKRNTFYTQVGLEIRRNAFGWAQYNILPYMLLHEILCHAYQGLGSPDLRPNAEPTDAWSEGWMDCVAYELALEWLKRQHGKHFKTLKERIEARDQIIELHKARYPKRASVEGALHPGNGRDIFYAVVGSYGNRYDNLSWSRHPVARLSLRLNAMNILPEKRMPHLETLRLLAKTAPAKLHALIGAINAEADDQVAVSLLR